MSMAAILAREGSRFCPMGRLLVGPCPRCGAAAPALQIHADLFCCTHCGLAGGPVQYLIALGETAEGAAKRLGIPLVVPQRVLRTLQMARHVYERALWADPDGPMQQFLHARGIALRTAARFHVGATPAPGTLIRHLLRQGLTPTDLVAAGLVRRRKDRFVEHLRARVVFPLCDAISRTIGFAGRAVQHHDLKYLNTKASAAGSLREVMFGLPQAERSIRKHGEAWVVEGYFDVLACHQAGLAWTIAPGGTHLTIYQALLLRRLTRRVVLLLDGDASPEIRLRAANSLRAVGLEAVMPQLPASTDPDELVLGQGPDALIRLVADATEAHA